jgi:hypothetical protein
MSFELDSDLLGRVADLNTRFAADVKSGITCVDIISALGQFSECVRYLNTRRSVGTKLSLQSEADVQDAIYLMLRPWISDLVWEAPTEKIANRFSIKDFRSVLSKTIIEAKYIRDESHGKGISKELHDDIEIYQHHPQCDHIVFFIYDPDSNIPDVQALQRQIEEDRVYGGRSLYCHLVVKP